MALTLSSLPSIYPVYTDNLNFTAFESTANANFTYNFSVYYNGVNIDTFDYFADPTIFNAEINLSTILQTQFTSTVFNKTGTTVFDFINNTINSYYIQVRCYNAANSLISSGITATRYVYNGIENTFETFSKNDYVFNSASTANFLTKWNTERAITINDKAYINTIIGAYGDINSSFAGIIITRYQSDNTISAATFTNTDNTTKKILNIDVSPANINANVAGFINTNTLYYTITEKNNRQKEIMKINIVKEYKNSNYYNFLYLNSLGGIDFFTSVKNYSYNYTITKELLDQFNTQKVYNTDINQVVNTATQILSIYQADKLKELFYSPAVKVWNNNILNDIRITNQNLVVTGKYPKDTIYYVINFMYNNKFYNQKY
jgi:hypothetical protein